MISILFPVQQTASHHYTKSIASHKEQFQQIFPSALKLLQDVYSTYTNGIPNSDDCDKFLLLNALNSVRSSLLLWQQQKDVLENSDDEKVAGILFD